MQTGVLTDFTGGILAVDQALSFTNLANVTFSSIVISNAVPAFPSLSNIDNTDLNLANGLSLSLPLVTTYDAQINADRSLTADGPGTTLSFPNLTTLNGSTGRSDDLFITATNGGQINFPNSPRSPTGLVSSAPTAATPKSTSPPLLLRWPLQLHRLRLPRLQRRRHHIPSLTTILDGNFVIDTTSSMQTSILTSLTGGTLAVDQALPFTSLTSANFFNFQIHLATPSFPRPR